MTIKKEYILLVLVIALLLVYIWYHQKNKMHYQLPELSQTSSQDITKLQIIHPEHSLTLQRQNGQWMIEPKGFPADPHQMSRLIDAITNLHFTALASTSQTYERYQLTEGHKIEVKVWEKDSLVRSFAIGKPGANYSTSFVKLDDDPNIYIASTNLRNRFSKDADQLRDKTVLSFQTGTIQSVTLNHQSKQLHIEKKAMTDNQTKDSNGTQPEKTSIWEAKETTSISSDKIQTLLSLLSDLKCSKFLAQPDQFPEKANAYTIRLKNSEHNFILDILPPKDNQNEDNNSSEYLGRSSETQDPFVLDTYTGKQILETFQALFQEKVSSGSQSD
jgi:hypothetical protein